MKNAILSLLATVSLSALAPIALAADAPAWQAQLDAGNAAAEKGDSAAARDQWKQALQAAEKANDLQAVAEIANKLANSYMAANDVQNASTYAKQAKDAAIKVLTSDPKTAALGAQLAKNEENGSIWIAHIMKAEFACQRNDFKTAETEYQAAVDKAREYSPEGMPMASALGGLGKTYVALGEYKKAEPVLRESIELCKKNWTPVTKNTALDAADALLQLATIYEKTGHKAEAAKLQAQSHEARENESVKGIELPKQM